MEPATIRYLADAAAALTKAAAETTEESVIDCCNAALQQVSGALRVACGHGSRMGDNHREQSPRQSAPQINGALPTEPVFTERRAYPTQFADQGAAQRSNDATLRTQDGGVTRPPASQSIERRCTTSALERAETMIRSGRSFSEQDVKPIRIGLTTLQVGEELGDLHLLALWGTWSSKFEGAPWTDPKMDAIVLFVQEYELGNHSAHRSAAPTR